MWAMSQSGVDNWYIAVKLCTKAQNAINLSDITSVSLLLLGICGKITVIKNLF